MPTSYALQVLLFPAMKPEDQKAGAHTSAAPPSAVQHPGPSSSLVTCFPSHMPELEMAHHLQQAPLVEHLEHLPGLLIEHAVKNDTFCPSLWSNSDNMLGTQRVTFVWVAACVARKLCIDNV